MHSSFTNLTTQCFPKKQASTMLHKIHINYITNIKPEPWGFVYLKQMTPVITVYFICASHMLSHFFQLLRDNMHSKILDEYTVKKLIGCPNNSDILTNRIVPNCILPIFFQGPHPTRCMCFLLMNEVSLLNSCLLFRQFYLAFYLVPSTTIVAIRIWVSVR